MPPSLQELISLLREDRRSAQSDNDELRGQVDDLRNQLQDVRSLLITQHEGTRGHISAKFEEHAAGDKKRSEELDTRIKSLIELLPKTCQATELTSAMRGSTYKHQLKLEIEQLTKERDEARAAAQASHREPTGPQRLPDPPFNLAGHTGNTGPIAKIDDDSIMPTPAQGRWLKRRWEWIKNNKLATGFAGSSLVGWLGHTPLWSAIKAGAKAAWIALMQ
jgi:hypothetical protein